MPNPINTPPQLSPIAQKIYEELETPRSQEGMGAPAGATSFNSTDSDDFEAQVIDVKDLPTEILSGSPEDLVGTLNAIAQHNAQPLQSHAERYFFTRKVVPISMEMVLGTLKIAGKVQAKVAIFRNGRLEVDESRTCAVVSRNLAEWWEKTSPYALL